MASSWLLTTASLAFIYAMPGLGSGLHDVGVYKRLAAMRVCSSLTIGFFPASCGCVTSVRRFPVLASGFNSSGGE